MRERVMRTSRLLIASSILMLRHRRYYGYCYVGFCHEFAARLLFIDVDEILSSLTLRHTTPCYATISYYAQRCCYCCCQMLAADVTLRCDVFALCLRLRLHSA